MRQDSHLALARVVCFECRGITRRMHTLDDCHNDHIQMLQSLGSCLKDLVDYVTAEVIQVILGSAAPTHSWRACIGKGSNTIVQSFH